MTGTLETLAGVELARQMAALKHRLGAEYDRGTVDILVDAECARFAGARVLTFVPILVERSVRARLAH
ncbi:MAG: three-helix bundle dimerization domain-containing protein [Actinophytocola sp.]|uniref:three-helix bundle dimerization domain-containing protein n=1 Tax=Actinophytocola sp. TaxID=1872138 RepID=UPI003D6B7239